MDACRVMQTHPILSLFQQLAFAANEMYIERDAHTQIAEPRLNSVLRKHLVLTYRVLFTIDALPPLSYPTHCTKNQDICRQVQRQPL